MSSIFIFTPTNLTQICAFKAPADVFSNILAELQSLGFKTQVINSGVNQNSIQVPENEDTIGYTYDSDLYGEGVGALDFITRIPQGHHPVKLAEIISSMTTETIRSTEQYIGDHGLAVEISVCRNGVVEYRNNSDEVFDKYSAL